MTVKIGNIQKYTLVPAGKAINLVGEEKRKVRLEVNCEYDTRFDVVQSGNVYFLAAFVRGHATLEFIVEGPCVVQPTSEGEVWLATDEGPHLVYETDEPSFVTLDFERQELTQFERLQAIANLRREQREAETEYLLQQLRAERAALEEAKKDEPAAKKPTDDNSGKSGAPAPSGDGEPEPEGEGQAG